MEIEWEVLKGILNLELGTFPLFYLVHTVVLKNLPIRSILAFYMLSPKIMYYDDFYIIVINKIIDLFNTLLW